MEYEEVKTKLVKINACFTFSTKAHLGFNTTFFYDLVFL